MLPDTCRLNVHGSISQVIGRGKAGTPARGERERLLWMFIGAAVVLALAEGRCFAQTAESRAVTLDWSAPEPCPNADWVLREVTRIAGDNQSAAGSVQARAVLSRDENRQWAVDLTTKTERSGGRRSFRAATCEAAASATAVIIALALRTPDTADGPPSPSFARKMGHPKTGTLAPSTSSAQTPSSSPSSSPPTTPHTQEAVTEQESSEDGLLRGYLRRTTRRLAHLVCGVDSRIG